MPPLIIYLIVIGDKLLKNEKKKKRNQKLQQITTNIIINSITIQYICIVFFSNLLAWHVISASLLADFGIVPLRKYPAPIAPVCTHLPYLEYNILFRALRTRSGYCLPPYGNLQFSRSREIAAQSSSCHTFSNALSFTTIVSANAFHY